MLAPEKIAAVQAGIANAPRFAMECNGCKSHKEKRTIFVSHPGPQSYVLRHQAKEILFGGARGGGKSAAGIVWMLQGNPALPNEHPLAATYINHPRFVGLVLRKERTDMEDWISRANEIYGHFGAKLKTSPQTVFEFPTGARIYINHLNDENAFEKYKGPEIHKVNIEELTLIASERQYLKLFGSCRSTIEGIRAQLFLTTNPDGAGAGWIKRRFVHVPMGDGNNVPWGMTMRDPVTSLTRVFIPARLSDNPTLASDPEYKAMLMAQDEVTRRQWLDGDWDVASDTFFRNFRPSGPQFGDPSFCKQCNTPYRFGQSEHEGHPHETAANHVIPAGSVYLAPWCSRAIGMDWGYRHNTAIYGVCFNSYDSRYHVYREFVRNQMDSEEIGATVAKLWLSDLESMESPHIPIYLSHDAFHVEDATRTRVERIKMGIERILGPDSVFLAAPTERERNYDASDRLKAMQDRYARIGGKAMLSLHPGRKDRIDGWQFIRSLLRFTPTVQLEFDEEFARRLLAEPDGMLKYEQYRQKFRNQKREVLPGILIWDNCPKLVQQLREAVSIFKERATGTRVEDVLEDGAEHSNDCLDALRYVLLGMSDAANREPLGVFVRNRMDKLRAQGSDLDDPTIRQQVWMKAKEDYDQGGELVGATISRASMRRRVM